MVLVYIIPSTASSRAARLWPTVEFDSSTAGVASNARQLLQYDSAISRKESTRPSMADQPLKLTSHQTRVYALLRQIPSGKVSTYAALSRALHSSPRAIGGALRVNPFAPEVPCHRVIQADGVSL